MNLSKSLRFRFLIFVRSLEKNENVFFTTGVLLWNAQFTAVHVPQTVVGAQAQLQAQQTRMRCATAAPQLTPGETAANDARQRTAAPRGTAANDAR